MPHDTRNMLVCGNANGHGERRVTAKRTRSRLPGLLSLALIAAALALPAAANAEIIQIPAITFANRSSAEIVGDANFGTLTNAKGTFYAAVPFPTSGAVVCRFILVHRDGDGDFDITARLLKKKIILGGLPFEEPIEMARVQTTGGVAGVQKVVDRGIRQKVIDLARAFYYVELTVPETLLEVLGVQIDVRTTCN